MTQPAQKYKATCPRPRMIESKVDLEPEHLVLRNNPGCFPAKKESCLEPVFLSIKHKL